jgi:hypothetical protein
MVGLFRGPVVSGNSWRGIKPGLLVETRNRQKRENRERSRVATLTRGWNLREIVMKKTISGKTMQEIVIRARWRSGLVRDYPSIKRPEKKNLVRPGHRV